MTVLAELARGLVAIQCDICVPPVLTINTVPDLQRTGWLLTSDGHASEVCPTCVIRVPARERTPRRDAEPVTPDPARLPNVVVVGATKAGTTSMHNYLGLHPEITVSIDKEVRFFQDPDCRDWLGRYQDQFAPGTRYRAESTPFYSKAPCFPGVAERMAALVPDARIIYLVRDPIDRIVAEYVEQMQWGAASRSLEVELSDAADPRNWLVASSRYATQLRTYREHFPAERIHVIDLADLAADTPGALGGVFDFLELDRPELGEDDFRHFNTREDKTAVPDWLHRLRRGPLARAVHRLPDGPRRVVSRVAWQRIRTPIEQPELSETTRAELERVLRPEVDQLRELTGGRYATWSL